VAPVSPLLPEDPPQAARLRAIVIRIIH